MSEWYQQAERDRLTREKNEREQARLASKPALTPTPEPLNIKSTPTPTELKPVPTPVPVSKAETPSTLTPAQEAKVREATFTAQATAPVGDRPSTRPVDYRHESRIDTKLVELATKQFNEDTMKFNQFVSDANTALSQYNEIATKNDWGKYDWDQYSSKSGSGREAYVQDMEDLKVGLPKSKQDYAQYLKEYKVYTVGTTERASKEADIANVQEGMKTAKAHTPEYVQHPISEGQRQILNDLVERGIVVAGVPSAFATVVEGGQPVYPVGTPKEYSLNVSYNDLTSDDIAKLTASGFTFTTVTAPAPRTKADWENIIEKYDQGIQVVWVDPLTNLATDLQKIVASDHTPLGLAAAIAYFAIQAPIGGINAVRGLVSPVQWINTAVLGYEILKTDYAIITRDPNRVEAPVLEGFVNYMMTHPGEFLIQTAAGLMVGHYVSKATTPVLRKIWGKMKEDLTLIQGETPDFPEGTVIGPKSALRKLTKFEETPTGKAAELAKIYEELGFKKEVIEDTFKFEKWDKKTGKFVTTEQLVAKETDYSANPKFDELGEGGVGGKFGKGTTPEGQARISALKQDLNDWKKITQSKQMFDEKTGTFVDIETGRGTKGQNWGWEPTEADMKVADAKMKLWEAANPKQLELIRKLERELGKARMVVVSQDYSLVKGLVDSTTDLTVIGTGSTHVPLVVYAYTALQYQGLTQRQIETALPVLLDLTVKPQALTKLDKETMEIVVPTLSVRTLTYNIPLLNNATLTKLVQNTTTTQLNKLMQNDSIITKVAQALNIKQIQDILQNQNQTQTLKVFQDLSPIQVQDLIQQMDTVQLQKYLLKVKTVELFNLKLPKRLKNYLIDLKKKKEKGDQYKVVLEYLRGRDDLWIGEASSYHNAMYKAMAASTRKGEEVVGSELRIVGPIANLG